MFVFIEWEILFLNKTAGVSQKRTKCAFVNVRNLPYTDTTDVQNWLQYTCSCNVMDVKLGC